MRLRDSGLALIFSFSTFSFLFVLKKLERGEEWFMAVVAIFIAGKSPFK